MANSTVIQYVMKALSYTYYFKTLSGFLIRLNRKSRLFSINPGSKPWGCIEANFKIGGLVWPKSAGTQYFKEIMITVGKGEFPDCSVF